MKVIVSRPLLLVVVTVCWCCASVSHADSLVDWTFQNATLSDGSTVTGSFVYDFTTNTLSGADVMVGPGTYHGSTTLLTSGWNDGSPQVPVYDILLGQQTVGSLELALTANGGPFTAAGGLVSLLTGSNALGTCEATNGSNCTEIQVLAAGYTVDFTGGSLLGTAVPLPGAAWLLLSGLGGLGARRGKRLCAAMLSPRARGAREPMIACPSRRAAA